ncbi:MAG: hypothetical protein ACHQ1D_01120 [Nitrososphaerales archaeon]
MSITTYAEITGNLKEYHTQVKCYDKFSNEIQGQTCDKIVRCATIKWTGYELCPGELR